MGSILHYPFSSNTRPKTEVCKLLESGECIARIGCMILITQFGDIGTEQELKKAALGGQTLGGLNVATLLKSLYLPPLSSKVASLSSAQR